MIHWGDQGDFSRKIYISTNKRPDQRRPDSVLNVTQLLLEEAGVIERYVAMLNVSKIEMGLTVFARVWLAGQDAETVDHFTNEIKQLPQVVECHLMSGDCDSLLRVVAADLDDYRRFQVEHLTHIKGGRNVNTEIPMQNQEVTVLDFSNSLNPMLSSHLILLPHRRAPMMSPTFQSPVP